MKKLSTAQKIGLMVAVICIVGAGAFIYQRATHVEMDLSPLEPYAETENYEALFERVHDQPIGEEGFKFVVLGDTRSNFLKAREVMTHAASHEPAFILSNGDLVRRGTVEEYLDHHLRLIDEIKPIPFIPAPGNHERGPNYDFSAFIKIYGDLKFSFDYGNCRFIGVNNGDRTKMTGRDVRYIRDELEKPGAEHAFVIFHQPPTFLENAVESEDSRGFTMNAKRLHKLFIEHGVNHVFVGHVHGFATEEFDGVRYTITGGAGANLTETLGDEGMVYNYVLVHVTPDGVRAEVYKQLAEGWVPEAIG